MKINQYIRIASLASRNIQLSTPTKFNFSLIKNAKQKFDLLYLIPPYDQGKYVKSKIIPYPSIAFFLYSSLTQWTTWNQGIFVGLLVTNIFLLLSFNKRYRFLVYSAQIDKERKNLYLTLRGNIDTLAYITSLKLGVSEEEADELLQNYHPLLDKYPDLDTKFISSPQLHKNRDVLNLEKNLIRLKLPIDKAQFQLEITQQVKENLQKDRLNLSTGELIKKYKKYDITVTYKGSLSIAKQKLLFLSGKSKSKGMTAIALGLPHQSSIPSQESKNLEDGKKSQQRK